jgi:hypothetical protein
LDSSPQHLIATPESIKMCFTCDAVNG